MEAALASGRPFVVFPRQAYRLSRTVEVPDHVLRLHFCWTVLQADLPWAEPLFRTTTGSTPLCLTDLSAVRGPAPLLDHASDRPLRLDSIHVAADAAVPYVSSRSGARADLHLMNVTGFGRRPTAEVTEQRVWARWINTERKGGPGITLGAGASMVVLGYKAEGASTHFEVRDGAKLEILGGIVNTWTAEPFDATTSPYDIADADASIVASSNGSPDVSKRFEIVVRDTRAGRPVEVRPDDLPAREGPRPREWTLPLYRN